MKSGINPSELLFNDFKSFCFDTDAPRSSAPSPTMLGEIA